MELMRAFTEHPASVDESYGRHLLRALGFGTRMMLAGIACLVHGFLPFLFARTGSRAITELNERMITRRGPSPRHGLAGEERLPL